VKLFRLLFDRWVWKTAWRDSRGSRRRFLLALTTVTLGTAALVAVHSFERNVKDAINIQAKALLGADLVISGRQPFSSDTEVLIHSLGGDQSREVRFASMAYFPKNGGTRLVQVRALAGRFPYYGLFETVFVPSLLPVMLLLLGVIGLTVLIGVFGNRGVYNQPPPAVLQSNG
jgi:predicted lysophospholipase L1 biosynthesis ABC-type transport system permease subunit